MEDVEKKQGLIVRGDFLPPAQVLEQIRSTCDIMVKSGILPAGIKTVEQAMVVALNGWEIGLPLMMAFKVLYPVKGRVGMMGEGKLALIRVKCPEAEIYFEKESEEEVVVKARRRKDQEFQQFRMSFKEAHSYGYDQAYDYEKKAWTEKAPWKNRRRMLKWRVISEMGAFMFPDIVGGLEDPDELNDYRVEAEPSEVEAVLKGSQIPSSTSEPVTFDAPEILVKEENVLELKASEPEPEKVKELYISNDEDSIAAEFGKELVGLKGQEQEALYNDYRERYKGKSKILLAIRSAYTKK